MDLKRRRAQFEYERRLRARILGADPAARPRIAADAYAELFEAFPDHDAVADRSERHERIAAKKAALIAPLARSGARVLEVGCGRGDVLKELAARGCECVGIESSEHMVYECARQRGFVVAWGAANRLEFPDEHFDLVFSQQVLEHLHPDDVMEHCVEVFRVLKPGGTAAIETPNSTTGPQDVSRGFALEAQGLHLKEWSFAEVSQQLRSVGFKDIKGLVLPAYVVRYVPGLHRLCRVPAGLKRVSDAMLRMIPGLALRTFIARVVGLNDVFLFGRKPHRPMDRT